MVSAKSYAIMLILVLPLVIYLWPSFLGGETSFLMVHGKSMLPTIQPGSLVIIKKTSDYSLGDIVSYADTRDTDKIIVHRIIEEVDDGFIIKGDNNRAKDPGIIPESNIIGEVIFATPYIGYGVEFARHPLVMVVIAVASLAIKSGKKKSATDIKDKVRKKKEYGLFILALAFNLVTYVVVQIAISLDLEPKVDPLTSYLFRMLMPSFASTVAFAIYFVVIILLYMLAKNYNPPLKRTKAGGGTLLLESNHALLGAQVMWSLFVVMAMVNLTFMLQALAEKIELL